MVLTSNSQVQASLTQASRQLRAVLAVCEKEIGAVANGFDDLARCTETVVDEAAAIVACVADERVLSILSCAFRRRHHAQFRPMSSAGFGRNS